MAKSCCQTPEPDTAAHNDPRWRRVLWIALIANAAMFVVEMVAGVAADSRSLQADALDFFGDAANYAISLGVAGMALAWRARAALVKAATMLAFGIWVIVYAIYGLMAGADPEPATMGGVGTLALATNLIVALMLFRFREGGAALGVFGTGQAWPDLLVASIMAGLALWGSVEVFGQARRELAHE